MSFYAALVNKRFHIRISKRLLRLIPLSLTSYVVWRRRYALSQNVHKKLGGRVVNGPFVGMKIPAKSFWGDTDIASQLLGFYEEEVLNEITSSKSRSTFINLGAADGYYSIGWAMMNCDRQSACRSIAFEINPMGRDLIQENSRVNGVREQVMVKGAATKESLLALLEDDGVRVDDLLLLSDIEGVEYQILDEEVLQRFHGAKWIIEAHEFNPEMRASLAKLIELAGKFYNVRVIIAGPRNPNQMPELIDLPDVDRWLICAEGRDGLPGKWLVFD